MEGKELERKIYEKYIEDSIQEMLRFANNIKDKEDEDDEQDK